MFSSVLVANRGEIACRIIGTCRRLGLRTVAVYSDADAEALHVAMADVAYRIGAAPARDSYLNIHAVIEAAKESGAEAVHPGYGFLAENAALAEACADVGLVFVGPPGDTIRAMGEKHAARALVASAGLPIVPGYHDSAQSPAALARAAAKVGFPLLLKPAAGGGGKGMRIVARAEDLAEAVAGAKREARSAFGSDQLILERFMPRARHIEVQVFGDRHGNVVHLFERDCSIQRRYQKVIEEAPAPALDVALRARLHAVAVAAAQAVSYVGAGTVEMLVDQDEAYFMEMNTRLQVEHPVTEMITGLDLVEWQLRVAAGEPLPLAQEEIRATGHAVEARLYAEDPERDFAPSTGRLALLRLPEAASGIRIDSGVREGDAISVHYDPMIAKIVAHGRGRDEAMQRLRGALAQASVAGVRTNLDLLSAILGRPEVIRGGVDTQLLARLGDALTATGRAVPDEALAAAVMFLLLERAGAAQALAAASADPHSPWHDTRHWRLHGEGRETMRFRSGTQAWAVTARPNRTGGYHLALPGGFAEVGARRIGDGIELDFGDRRMRIAVARENEGLAVFLEGRGCRLRLEDPMAATAVRDSAPGTLTAPIPGIVSAVLVTPGARVRRGEALLVLEAMKMEHQIRSPADGTVETVRVGVGEQVQEGAELVRVRAAE